MRRNFALLFSCFVLLLISACDSKNSSIAVKPTLTPEHPASTVSKKPDTIDNFSYYVDERVPEEVRDVIIENRKELFVNLSPDFEANPGKYINLDYDKNADNGVVEILENPGPSMVKLGRLSYDVVEKELDFLMDYLKYAYGAYEYYGGDAVFHPMKDRIIAELKAKNESSASFSSYREALYQHLHAAVVDCHFVIGQRKFLHTQRYQYFLRSEKYIFEKIDERFYADIGGVAYELKSVDSEIPDLLPYLDKSGHMVWVIGESATANKSKSVHILLLNEQSGNTIEDRVKLKAAAGTAAKAAVTMYYEYEKNGIKIAESPILRHGMEPEEDMFLGMNTYGQNIRGENVVVIDLRNGAGGNSLYAQRWVEGYLGHEINGGRGVFTSRRTETTYYTSSKDGRYNGIYDTYEQFIETGAYEHWTQPSFSPCLPNANEDTLFIVLTNGFTMSASESFVDYLRQTENTIVVGTNTGGLFMTGNIVTINLPYSKIPFTCGFNFHLEPDLTSIESIGIQPDLWAPSLDSLDRVLKFIENYNLAGN